MQRRLQPCQPDQQACLDLIGLFQSGETICNWSSIRSIAIVRLSNSALFTYTAYTLSVFSCSSSVFSPYMVKVLPVPLSHILHAQILTIKAQSADQSKSTLCEVRNEKTCFVLNCIERTLQIGWQWYGWSDHLPSCWVSEISLNEEKAHSSYIVANWFMAGGKVSTYHWHRGMPLKKGHHKDRPFYSTLWLSLSMFDYWLVCLQTDRCFFAGEYDAVGPSVQAHHVPERVLGLHLQIRCM